MVVFTDWADALRTSAANALTIFLSAIPRIIGFLVILILGWLFASIVAGVVGRLLRSIRFNEFAERAGIAGFLRRTGTQADAASVVTLAVKWFMRLIVLLVAFDTLGLPAVSQVLESLLLRIPDLIVALVILMLAGLAARALSGIVRGAASEAGVGNPDILARVASGAVWAFAVIIALNQVGVADELVNTLFIGLVGAIALALGLAFGLGGREMAAQLLASWYERGQAAQQKLQSASGNETPPRQGGRPR